MARSKRLHELQQIENLINVATYTNIWFCSSRVTHDWYIIPVIHTGIS